MKIVQVTTELRLAGAEKVILEICKGLVKAGHEVSVMSLKKIPKDRSQTIYQELNELGVKIYSLNLSLFSILNIFKLKELFKAFDPDIVHSHLIHSNILCRVLVPNGIPLVNTVHIAEKRPTKWWHFLLDKITLSKCNIQTCVSQAVAEFHSVKIGVSLERLPVVYNGLSKPKKLLANELNDLKFEWGLQDCNKIIGSVGRLNQQKGYDWFLSELESIKVPENEKWGIVIIGEGEDRRKLERLMNKLPCGIKCYLPGFRKDAASCIEAFDCFVMPSNYEGFGLTLIEAMSHGVPIVAHSVDSLPELIEHYSNGICVNKEIFVQTIIEMMYLPKVEPNYYFSAENMVRTYLKIYKSLT